MIPNIREHHDSSQHSNKVSTTNVNSSAVQISESVMGFSRKSVLVTQNSPVGLDHLHRRRPSEMGITDFMNLSKQQKSMLETFNKLAELKWFVEEKRVRSGESFGDVNSKETEFMAYTLSDSHFAELDERDYQRALKKIAQENFEKKLKFFQGLPCFSSVSQMLLKKLMALFAVEKDCKRGDFVYKQGELASKVFVIFEGDFEIVRRKNNKLTKKEEEYKKIRFMNEYIKNGEHHSL
mmetsp:Transcript_22661/g.34957  ORF Transcript_22661/g.34957 Transcript_22661/m.34957 type:complete len:237 (+) Transcript_22661:140-850(+)